MKILTIILVLLSVLHVLYGPHFYRKPVSDWKLASLSRTCKRLFYLTNMCFAVLALLNTYPSNKLFTIALVLIISSVFGYWRFLVIRDNYPLKYILDHIVLFIPLLMISYYNGLSIEWKLNYTLLLIIIGLACYTMIYTKIYL